MRPISAAILSLACLLLCAGCVSVSPSYVPSTRSVPLMNAVDVDRPMDDAWTKLIHGLAIGTLDIVTMDRQTGFVSVGYSGDPEEYVDGGEILLTIHQGQTDRIIRFPAAKADTSYTIDHLGSLARTERQVYLDGKVNIVLEEAGAHRTRITVNARYTLTINTTEQPPDGTPATSQEVVSFNTGKTAKTRSGVIFQPNGRLEEAIIALVR